MKRKVKQWRSTIDLMKKKVKQWWSTIDLMKRKVKTVVVNHRSNENKG